MNYFKRSLLTGMLACSLALTGCTAASDFGAKVATVNGTVISKSAYEKTYSEFEKAFRLTEAPEEQKAAMADTLKQMTLNKLILQTLVQNAADKEGVKVSEEDIKKYKQEKIFSNPLLQAQFKTFLEQNNMKESDFDKMLQENLLMDKFMDLKGGAMVKVTDPEIQAFYNQNKARFNLPERINAKHILLKAIVPEMKKEIRKQDEKISDADLDKKIATEKATIQKQAEDLYKQVVANPAQFEEVAKKNSQDPVSAVNGGDLGDMAEASIDPAFWAAAKKTAAGQLHPGVVTTQFGYHIIKVLEHKAPHQQSFAEAKPMIEQQLAAQKKQGFLQTWVEEQKKAAKIEIEPAYQAQPQKANAAKEEGMKADLKALTEKAKEEAGKHVETAKNEAGKHVEAAKDKAGMAMDKAGEKASELLEKAKSVAHQ
jgi:parvulin-like peptidyl-prolyl isomerase